MPVVFLNESKRGLGQGSGLGTQHDGGDHVDCAGARVAVVVENALVGPVCQSEFEPALVVIQNLLIH